MQNQSLKLKIVKQYCDGNISSVEARRLLGNVSRTWLNELMNKFGLSGPIKITLGQLVSEEEKTALVSGTLKLRDLATEMGTNRASLRESLKRCGVKIPRYMPYKKVKKQDRTVIAKSDVKDYLNNRITHQGLEDKYGRSRASIHTALIRQGVVKTRSVKYHHFILSPDDIRRLQNRETTITAMCKNLKISTATLYRAMLRQKVEITED